MSTLCEWRCPKCVLMLDDDVAPPHCLNNCGVEQAASVLIIGEAAQEQIASDRLAIMHQLPSRHPRIRADFYDLTTGEMREAGARLPAAGAYKT